ncbi:hypothetical protein OBBRIDRAFT_374282 [Obba rivulosa]|uniref:Uncharacterized protein n=1 Tax=Obba rivulosa TaxID=1052685 RepID=A0A8E2AM93_9APHY|nr:hypothetical protein OBBRIDRAFT_374282 [Obba rivulosa]
MAPPVTKLRNLPLSRALQAALATIVALASILAMMALQHAQGSSIGNASPMPPSVRMATYNLRFDSEPDSKPVQQSIDELPSSLQEPRYSEYHGEQPWSLRRVKIAQQLLNEDVVLVGE